jgi:sugar phosphate isomerase/epimerase
MSRTIPPIGIFAKMFVGTEPAVVLSQARDAGFDVVQYNMACSGLPPLPSAVSPDVIDALRAASAETGVGIAALSATANLIHPHPAVLRTGLRAIEVLADVAQQLAIPVLTLCSGSRNAEDPWASHPENQSAAAWGDLLSSLDVALRAAERCGVRLGLEPERANVLNSADAARRLLDEVRSDRLGIVLDVANLVDLQHPATVGQRRATIARAVEVLAHDMVLLHAKDCAADGRAVVPGQGIAEVAYALDEVRRAGVSCPVIAHGVGAAHAGEAASYLRARLSVPVS